MAKPVFCPIKPKRFNHIASVYVKASFSVLPYFSGFTDVRSQPSSQAGLHFDESSALLFGHDSRDIDVPALEIDVFPIQPCHFRVPNTRKCADRDERQNVKGRGVQ